MSTYIKDPDAVLDYKLDYAAWLGDGETITTSSWTVDGVTVDSASFDGTSATVWLSGGTLPRGTATNRVSTSAGRTDDRTIRLIITNR